MAPRKASRPAAALADGEPRGCLAGRLDDNLAKPSRRESQASIVAEIEISHATRLRISLTSWKGARKVELRLYTATIPSVYMATSDGLSLPVGKLPELIAALRKANAAASSREGGAP
jgi:hypothetical protein